MRRLIYLSNAKVAFDVPMLDALLLSARRFNGDHQVTGALVHAGGGFIQLLEGEPHEVEAVYRRVTADTRHQVEFVPIDRSVPTRLFDGFTMHHDDTSQPVQTADFVRWLQRYRALDRPDQDVAIDLLVRFWEDRAGGNLQRWAAAWPQRAGHGA